MKTLIAVMFLASVACGQVIDGILSQQDAIGHSALPPMIVNGDACMSVDGSLVACPESVEHLARRVAVLEKQVYELTHPRFTNYPEYSGKIPGDDHGPLTPEENIKFHYVDFMWEISCKFANQKSGKKNLEYMKGCWAARAAAEQFNGYLDEKYGVHEYTTDPETGITEWRK